MGKKEGKSPFERVGKKKNRSGGMSSSTSSGLDSRNVYDRRN